MTRSGRVAPTAGAAALEKDPQALLQLEAGPEAKGFVGVDAMLEVIYHPRLVVGPADVAAFVEYRLEDAVRVGP